MEGQVAALTQHSPNLMCVDICLVSLSRQFYTADLQPVILQEGRLKPPLGGLRLLDKGRICSEAMSCFSKTEQQSSSFAAAIRAKAVLALYAQQERQLAKKGLMKPLLEIEMPLARVLSEMECKGICMDRRVYNISKQPLLRRQEEVCIVSTTSQIAINTDPPN